MATVKICVCGDDGTGKTTLIRSFVKGSVDKVPAVLPVVNLSPLAAGPMGATTQIVDTCALPTELKTMTEEVRKANVILLVFGNDYSFDRVGLFWMPFFRSTGVNVPVVLCANGLDEGRTEEMAGLMADFREIDTCIRANGLTGYNVTETFYLCQKAVLFPVAPLYDSKEGRLKDAAKAALSRVFFLADVDKDGLLDEAEMGAVQVRCFDKAVSEHDMERLKDDVGRLEEGSVVDGKVSLVGWLRLCRLFVQLGRHETVWTILRRFGYLDSLALPDSVLHPRLEVSALSSVELSPAGFEFLAKLFILFDKDNDGRLAEADWTGLFAHTAGLPDLWRAADFPACTACSEGGYITLQGWLAAWCMLTRESGRTAVEYLALLGFDNPVRAVKVTRPRRANWTGVVERDVLFCYVVGGRQSGKSSFLDAFLGRALTDRYEETVRPRWAVNSVEMAGGKQRHLILLELGPDEDVVLSNRARLGVADMVCYVYDSADRESFAHVASLRRRIPGVNDVPAVYVGLKADLDKATQRWDCQPDEYTARLGLDGPIHTSVGWSGISDVFVSLAEVAIRPENAVASPELVDAHLDSESDPTSDRDDRDDGDEQSGPGRGGRSVTQRHRRRRLGRRWLRRRNGYKVSGWAWWVDRLAGAVADEVNSSPAFYGVVAGACAAAAVAVAVAVVRRRR